MNKIYLIGLPGAGKTHSGKLLAANLGWEFRDLDWMIEDTFGKPVREIFEDHGEDVFRQMESEVLKKTAGLTNTVISCGGGTPIWNDNMEWLQRHGLTIYLNPPIDTIIPRILKNEKKRPMFRGMKEGQLRNKLIEFEVKRGDFYSKARFIWNKSEPNAKMYSAVNQLLKLYSAPL